MIFGALFTTILSSQLTWASPPSLNYSAPIVITSPGTYSGNYQSVDGTPAIEIYSNGEVTIENCNVTGPGTLIRVWSETKLTIRNCNGFGVGHDPGQFLQTANLKAAIIENNYFENVSKGILIYQFHGNGQNGEIIRIARNVARNIRSESDRGSFLQFNQVVNVSGVEVAFNQVINEPGVSAVEDNINLYNSSGTSTSPIRVHDNYVQGAYPRDLNSAFTGTGMTSDGDGNALLMSGNIEATENTFVSTCNASMNLAGGFNIRYHHNRMVTSNQKPDGSGAFRTGCTWAATGAWNNFNLPAGSALFRNNSIDHNVIAFVRPGISLPFPDRQDVWSGCVDGICHDNESLPNPVSLDTERNEWNRWNQKLASQQITVGSSQNRNNGLSPLGSGVNPFFNMAPVSTPTPAPSATASPAPTATPVATLPPSSGSYEWKLIGYEYDLLNVPEKSLLRYGNLTQFLERTLSGSFTASNDLFGGDPAPGSRKAVYLGILLKTNTLQWEQVGTEGDFIRVSGVTQVRYSAFGREIQKTVSADFFASNGFFGGDPFWGISKKVEVLRGSAQWVVAGYEGKSLKVPANSTIRYGTESQYIVKTVSGRFSATNEFFGQDPALGIYKTVWIAR